MRNIISRIILNKVKICLKRSVFAIFNERKLVLGLAHVKVKVSVKEEVICRINPANSNLFAGLIRQIVTYLPDNRGHEKRGGSHGQNI